MKNERKPEITIRTNGITGTEILVDGKKLDGVTGFRFSQSYKENSGLPILQIDLKATNVSLDTQMLPALPEPFNEHYVSVNSLLNSKIISIETVNELCGENGIDLCVLSASQTEASADGPRSLCKKQIELAENQIGQYVQQYGEDDFARRVRGTLEKLRGLNPGNIESLNVVRDILTDWAKYAKGITFKIEESEGGSR